MRYAVRFALLASRNGKTRAVRWDFLRDPDDLSKAAIFEHRYLAEREANRIGGDVICLDDENLCLLCPVF